VKPDRTELVAFLAIAVAGVGEADAEPVVLGEHAAGLADPRGHHPVDAAGDLRRHLLGQQADADAGGADHLAVLGADVAEDQPQQRRLAAAVAPHQRHPLTAVEAQPHPFEERRTAEGQGHVAEVEEGHGAHCKAPGLGILAEILVCLAGAVGAPLESPR